MTEKEIENKAFEKLVTIEPDLILKDGTCYVNYITLEKVLIEFAKEILKEKQ